MKYTKVSIKTTTDAVDFISNLFDEIGLEGIQIEDNIPLSEEDKKAMYIDILPELPEDDGTATVSSYFEEGTFQIDELRKQIEEGLEEIAIFVTQMIRTGLITGKNFLNHFVWQMILLLNLHGKHWKR